MMPVSGAQMERTNRLRLIPARIVAVANPMILFPLAPRPPRKQAFLVLFVLRPLVAEKLGPLRHE